MFERFFRLAENKTSVRTEIVAGVTTFLTMAYIIFVQPAVLSGKLFGFETGMDFGAVTTATCLAAALATTLMALLARYPIAQAPGIGRKLLLRLYHDSSSDSGGFREWLAGGAGHKHGDEFHRKRVRRGAGRAHGIDGIGRGRAVFARAVFVG